jgi:hypothetical protein
LNYATAARGKLRRDGSSAAAPNVDRIERAIVRIT